MSQLLMLATIIGVYWLAYKALCNLIDRWKK